jgi:hypothetical protein
MRELNALINHLGLSGPHGEARLELIRNHLPHNHVVYLSNVLRARRTTPLDDEAAQAQHDAALTTVNLLSENELAAAFQQAYDVDETTARAIACERTDNGPYTSFDDLRQRVPAVCQLDDSSLLASLPRRTELHNHMGGVFTVDDIVHMVGHNAGPEATELERMAYVHRLIGEAIERGDIPPSVASAYRAGSDDSDLSFYEGQLNTLLTAGDIPFNDVYPVRNAVFRGQDIDAEQQVRQMLQRLAVQGIDYAELQAGIFSRLIDPATLARLCDETGVEVRALAYLSSRNNMSVGSGGDPNVVPQRVRSVIDAVFDPVAGRFTVGVDYAGPERRFTDAGIDRFVATAGYMRSKIAAGETAIMRIHVGEGYFANATSPEARRQGIQDAQDNVAAIIGGIQRHRADTAGSDNGDITFRLGHVTHVTDQQLATLAQLNVHVEVNLGSNMTTGAVQTEQEHPVLRMIYHNVDISVNTDAGGVMGTDLDIEYDSIRDIVQDYQDGDIQLEIDGESKPFESLSREEQARFDIDRLERNSRTHQRLPR